MRRTRRQTVIRAFEVAGVCLVAVDVLLYVVGYRPVQAMVFSQQEEFARLRRRTFEGAIRIEQLNTFLAALPDAGQKLVTFEKEHAPPRRQGYSQAHELLSHEAEQSGTQLVSVAYKLDSTAPGPLQRLSLVVSVTGPFPALLKFAHALETTNELMVMRNFSIGPGEGGALALRLVADLYLTP